MKKVVITCGLIAGTIVSVFMLSSIAWSSSRDNFEGSMLVGYASMLLSFSLIFVGIKNFRDKYNHGLVSFGKAFQIGLYITLIASTMYVIAWYIDYHFFVPDFMDKFTDATLKELRAEGVSGAELEKQIVELNSYKEMYKNPAMIILMTYMEILPVGLLVSLISALLLKKQSQPARVS
ncbi:DUF4199 domain-containing protein [Dyadobacter arcticus]|uniref:DUF4199 domain-containing protein n=1 Tax=Dyadobacter arcticus TaxID=1078754 RepID=A0ABX0UMY3_9BACT|nr:DUF4199 domain-containing protein [Dyadobacter arcticus]NIJ54307.1 hypothetical protein [Dyadobacter arcticus]